MKYPYIVIKNGVWYPAGTEVPEGANPNSGNISKDIIVVNQENLVTEALKNTDKAYTKTEINRMSTSELQDLALNNGVADANSMTGAELKKLLIEKFEL